MWIRIKTRKKSLAAAGAAAALAIAIPLVGHFEGLCTTAYLDAVNVPTICFGETRGVHLGDLPLNCHPT